MEITIDLKNYDESLPVFHRRAARGVIEKDGKYLLIQGNNGDIKFPGGGMEAGETPEETLVREVAEETGFSVLPDSIKPWGIVHERRHGSKNAILQMESFYFFCKVSDTHGAQKLDDYEQAMGYLPKWLSLEEATSGNRQALGAPGIPWVKRDLQVLELLKKEQENENPQRSN